MSTEIKFKLNIGDIMPRFKLKDSRGNIVSDADFKNKKILIIVFASVKCPVYKDYEDRLIELQKEFEDKGVQIIAINSNYDEKIEDMIKRAKEKNYNFPYLKDETQEVARNFGAICTPHVFVFDEKRILRYQGRIDDNRNPSMVKSRDLKEAIEALLKGEQIKNPLTRPFGCSIVWKVS